MLDPPFEAALLAVVTAPDPGFENVFLILAKTLDPASTKLSNDSLSTAELYRNRHIKESLEQKLKVLTYIYDNVMQCKQRANRTILNVH